MRPFNKFGRSISDETYQTLLKYEKILLKEGYREAATKPNLFLKKIAGRVFFVDMRGTRDDPLLSDALPSFYWQGFTYKDTDRKMYDSVREVLRPLLEQGLQCHNDSVGRIFSIKDIPDESLSCATCGKDIDWGVFFCSAECEEEGVEKIRESEREMCAACNVKIAYAEELPHHVSYFPEKIVSVHKSCHQEIHKSDKYIHLRPPDGDSEKFYKKTNSNKKISNSKT